MKGWIILTALFRTKWLIALLVGLFVLFNFFTTPNTTCRLVLYKLMLAVVAAVIGHIVIKALYPYIDLRNLLYEDKKNESPDAIKFLGACILRAMVMAAIIIGVLTGI